MTHLKLPRHIIGIIGILVGLAGQINEVWAETTPSFGVVGDTQQTLWIEKVFLRREDNRSETRTLVTALGHEPISTLIHAGDMVGNAMWDPDWDEFDSLVRLLDPISIYPAMGNHDYWGFNFISLPKVYKRFPILERSRWYSTRFGPTAVVFLDSNDDQLSLREWRTQKNWFISEMSRLDLDPTVIRILVVSHHPPYTSSRAVGGSRRVREDFLPTFFRTAKAVAYISGHAHGHERYRIGGKLFIVTGGGGGARHDHRDSPSEYIASFPHPFHYLIATPTASGLTVQMKGFQKGDSDVRVIDQFTIP